MPLAVGTDAGAVFIAGDCCAEGEDNCAPAGCKKLVEAGPDADESTELGDWMGTAGGGMLCVSVAVAKDV
jgi:hypothetical protein